MEAARAWGRGGPSQEDLAAAACFGFTAEDYANEAPTEVWPDNWPAVMLFCDLGTQWRAGLGGPTGLDYPVAWALMDRRGLTGEAWEAMFTDLQTMEQAVLKQHAERRQ